MRATSNVLVLLAATLLALLAIEGFLHVYNPFGFRLRGNSIVLPANMRYAFNGAAENGLDSEIVHTKNAIGFRGPMQPNMVLFLVGANDVGLSNQKSDDDRLNPASAWSSPRGFLLALAQHTEIGALVLNLYRYRHTVRWGLAQGEFHVPRDPGSFAPATTETPDATANTLIAAHAAFRDGYRARLESLVRESVGAGIVPVLITQPFLLGDAVDPRTGVDLSRVRLDLWGSVLDGHTQWRLLDSYNDVTRDVAATLDVPVIDLARLMPKTTRYFYDSMHFNNDGATAVAAFVAAALCPVLASRFPSQTGTHCVGTTN